MASHGYDHDFDIVDADGWNQYDSYAMRRAPQQTSIHMTQKMTTKVGSPCIWWTNQFLCFWGCNWWLVWHHRARTWKTWTCIEDQIGRWGISVQKTTGSRYVERSQRWCQLFQKILATSFHQGSPERVLVSFHAVHEVQQRNYGSSKVDDEISTDWK